jgi:uncharacterized cofD-like protein
MRSVLGRPPVARAGIPPLRHGRDLRIVALGGGTGLPVTLHGLKEAMFSDGAWHPGRDRDRLVGIATSADDGGSSGMLRAAYQVPAPGDLRNCLLALSDADPMMAKMFDFRFDRAEIAGHSLGNLILTALSQLEQDFSKAIEHGARMLDARGRVFPSTLESAHLAAELTDGTAIEGESSLVTARRPIRRLRLSPADAAAPAAACEAVEAAHAVVIGPGSLYSSLIAVLLVRDLAEALARSSARVILVMNLMTEPGETDGYTAVDHVLALCRHAVGLRIHDILVNVAPMPPVALDRYGEAGASPVAPDRELLAAMGHRVVERDLLDSTGGRVRHDPTKVATAILDVIRGAAS